MHWEKLREKFSRVTDRLGMPIDAEILETVVDLNALDIPTTMSCGGHIDERGFIHPWMHIGLEDPILTDLKKRSFALQREIDPQRNLVRSMTESGASSQELIQARAPIDEQYVKIREVDRQIRAFQIPLYERIVALLDQFYDGRLVPFDRRLIVTPLGQDRVILNSQGVTLNLYMTAPEEIQRLKLLEYRQEMADLAAFLHSQVQPD